MAIPYFIDNGRNNDIKTKYGASDIVWSDEFTGDSLDLNKWRYEYRVETSPGTLGGQYKYQADLNRQATNEGILANGVASPGQYTDGKRFAAWQNAHRDRCHVVGDGWLSMGGYVSDEVDPTVPSLHPDTNELINPYTDPLSGKSVDLRNKVYSSWIDSSGIARMFPHPTHGNAPYVDPDSPRHAWRYGYFEADFDFRLMDTPGFRQSWWLMPHNDPDAANPELYPLDTNGNSVAGDGIAASGAEIDIFEYEPSERSNYKQGLLMKVPLVFGTEWGRRNTYADQWGYKDINGNPFIFDLRLGLVTIGLEWNPNYLGFYVNGVEVNRDYTRVPHVGQYFNLTREMTAVCGESFSAAAFHPYRADYSGGGWLYGDNVGAYQDRIDADKCLVSHIRVWQDSTVNGVWRSPYNQTHAVDPNTPSGDVTRIADAAEHGIRFGVPVRYSPNPDRNDIVLGDTTVTVSTTSVDAFALRYENGSLLWNDQGRAKWDISRVNVDDVDNYSDYVGTATTTPSFNIDNATLGGSGIFFVTATDGEFIRSQPINVVQGSNSIVVTTADVAAPIAPDYVDPNPMPDNEIIPPIPEPETLNPTAIRVPSFLSLSEDLLEFKDKEDFVIKTNRSQGKMQSFSQQLIEFANDLTAYRQFIIDNSNITIVNTTVDSLTGVIITTPDGTKYSLELDNDGTVNPKLVEDDI